MSFSIQDLKNVLILGDGDIGSALIKQVELTNPNATILATSRDVLDPTSENSWEVFVKSLPTAMTFDLIISTYGMLKNPEKKIEDINMDLMIEHFKINALHAPLAIKHLKPFINRKAPTVVAFLSAMVGSISDNKIGGWYTYRASKSALNMFVKTMAIEFERKKYQTSFMAIHPGTTETKLSRPHLKLTSLKVWSPEETARHILDTIEKSYPEGTGIFKKWDGSNLDW